MQSKSLLRAGAEAVKAAGGAGRRVAMTNLWSTDGAGNIWDQRL